MDGAPLVGVRDLDQPVVVKVVVNRHRLCDGDSRAARGDSHREQQQCGSTN